MDAADSGALPPELVFVDLETTGGNVALHRITEVGIVRLRADGSVEEWSSLVNPGCRIPPYIESFTGITNAMVASAPSFEDIAAEVLRRLSGAVFVAHNARFDYSFLRNEFRRLDLNFTARVMCTVRLSRRLFPQHPKHSLDAVMERHGLTCAARHRALGDARVLADFWRKLLEEVPAATLGASAQLVIGANRLPAHLPPGLADELPEGPGVYRFFGEGDALLYIGKSRSLRTRILGHFAAGHGDPKEQKKALQTRRIDWVETAGNLGAELKEAEWIKTQKPLYNKRLKPRSDTFTLRRGPSGRGVALAPLGDPVGGRLDDCFGLFQSAKDGRKALTEIARAHALCLKVLGLEEGAGSCFAHQVGRCRGACVGKEPHILHDTRLMMALSALKLKSWPYPGRVALREGHAEFHVFDPWVYLGTARSEDDLADIVAHASPAAFDVDVYRILVRYLRENPHADWRDLRARLPDPASHA
jgi:DNA polymerase-3 subunit epsilon